MASGAERPAPPLPHSKSFFASLLRVLYAPREAFGAIANAPVAFAAISFSFVLSAGVSALVLETDIGQLALLDQWERTASAVGQRIDDVRYANMQAASASGWLYAVVSAAAGGPLLTIVLSAWLFFTLRVSPAVRVTYRQVLAVVAYAGVVLTLRQVVTAPLVYIRETFGSPLTLQLLVPTLDEGSLLARVSAAMDLFVIWWLIVLAIGMSVLYRRSARRLAVTFLGAYLVLAGLLATAVALAGGSP